MAARVGLEPTYPIPETGVLPLDDLAIAYFKIIPLFSKNSSEMSKM